LEDTYKLDPYFNLAYQSNLKMSPGNSGLDLVSKLGLGSLDPTTANFSAKHFTRANGSQNLITILYEMNKGLVGYEVGSNVFNAKQFRLPTWLLALGNSKFINSDNNFCEANYCGQ
jgi:hypothetical protein